LLEAPTHDSGTRVGAGAGAGSSSGPFSIRVSPALATPVAGARALASSPASPAPAVPGRSLVVEREPDAPARDLARREAARPGTPPAPAPRADPLASSASAAGEVERRLLARSTVA